jgi:hypothetical protein
MLRLICELADNTPAIRSNTFEDEDSGSTELAELLPVIALLGRRENEGTTSVWLTPESIRPAEAIASARVPSAA